jgi:hypothetical protein
VQVSFQIATEWYQDFLNHEWVAQTNDDASQVITMTCAFTEVEFELRDSPDYSGRIWHARRKR